ncbi:helix-turn-helix domain-containing protein [Paenibacillus sp. IHBB 3054]|uniref:LexA family protein n=1 Tax=Paenibacillus sp. IHBB 3054 TaxID=3425689 RepID=UPI003F67474D
MGLLIKPPLYGNCWDKLFARMEEQSRDNQAVTKRQSETLELIKKFIDQRGCAPSVTEVAELLKLKSRSTAHSLVEQLVRKGFLTKTDKEVWTLRVVGQEDSNVLKPYEAIREENARLLQENAELRKKLAGFEKR